MAYNVYNPSTLTPLHIHSYPEESFVYDKDFSLLEIISHALEKLNENIETINSLQTAIIQFQEYVIEELSQYDNKIVQEVTSLLNQYITDGTIANLINNTVFSQINTHLTNLDTTVSQNKTDLQTAISNLNTTLSGRIDTNDSDIQTLKEEIAYVAPSVSFSTNPTPIISEKGVTLSQVLLVANLTKGSKNLQKIDYYKNNVIIHTKLLSGTETQDFFIDSNVNSDSTYKVILTDGTKNIESSEFKFDFVYPFYIGKSNDTITSTVLKGLSNSLQYKASFRENFITNGENIVIAYPSSYGDLTNILDDNNLELLDSFTKSTLNMQMKDNSNQTYNVYVSNDDVYLNNYFLNFIFDGDTSILTQNLTIDFNSLTSISGGHF